MEVSERGTLRRGAVDDVLLGVARLVMDVSVRAADDLGGLSPVQLRALTALRHRDGVNLAQLAQAMGVAVSTASRLVDRLVSADWVRREPAPSNRREISLRLSGAGEQLLDRYDDHRLLRMRSCLDGVPADRQDAVVSALAELAEAARPEAL